MSSYMIRFFTGVCLLIAVGASRSSGESCLSFSSPSAEFPVIISSPCTLAVSTEPCDRRVRKVEFASRYFPSKSDTSTIAMLGTVTKKPYTVTWDISEIPNQVFTGATLYADVTFSNGVVESLLKERVFFIHQPVNRHVYAVPFNFRGNRKQSGTPVKLISRNKDITAQATVYWNSGELVFIIDVDYRLFSSEMKGIGDIGAEIVLDPNKSRKPFPGSDVFLYTVPLRGKPYRTVYTKETDDSGAVRLGVKTPLCPFPAVVTKNEGKGFQIYFPIPAETFGEHLPEIIGCNIAVKAISSKGIPIKAFWVEPSSSQEFYSPYIWGELQLKERPLLMNRLLVALLGFGAGFLATLLIAALIMAVTRPVIRRTAAQSEADRQQFILIKPEFDRNITAKNVTIDKVASAVNMPAKKLAILIKQATGMPFFVYVMYARIEIAKERLRSSHASEKAIAEACGFASTAEMEKYFLKFCHLSPAKFREEQQVA